MGVNQGAVADKIGTWVGQALQWRAFSISEAGSEHSLVYAWRKKNWGQLCALLEPPASTLEVCCWEMPIFAAIKTPGALTSGACDTLMLGLVKDRFKKAKPMMTGSWRRHYGYLGTGCGAEKPRKGDLVFFMSGADELAHCAVGLGTETDDGESRVYSHWSTRSRTGPIASAVEITTVEALERIMKKAFGSAPSVYSAAPVW